MLAEDIDIHHLWLLEEGHCMRSQIMRLCELKKMSTARSNFQYEAGSIQTLLRLVETKHGITIIPELALTHLTSSQMKMVRRFKPPVPSCEVSLVTHRSHLKQRMLDALQTEILRFIPGRMLKSRGRDILKPRSPSR